MSDPSLTGYAVLLKNPSQFDVSALAALLAKLQKVPLADAAQYVKHHPGFLATGLDQAAAEQLAQSFAQNGLDVITVAESNSSLLNPVVASAIDFKSDVLCANVPNNTLRIPWNHVSVIATGVLRSFTSKTIKVKEAPSTGNKLLATGILLTTGIPLGFGKSKSVEKTVHESNTVFLMDLFIQSATRLRLFPENLAYDFLGEGKKLSTLENFRALAQELSVRAPQAIRNKATEVWLANQPIAGVVLNGEAEFDIECRWLGVLAGLSS